MGVARFEADVAVSNNSNGNPRISAVGGFWLDREKTLLKTQTSNCNPDPGVPADAESRTRTQTFKTGIDINT